MMMMIDMCYTKQLIPSPIYDKFLEQLITSTDIQQYCYLGSTTTRQLGNFSV